MSRIAVASGERGIGSRGVDFRAPRAVQPMPERQISFGPQQPLEAAPVRDLAREMADELERRRRRTLVLSRPMATVTGGTAGEVLGAASNTENSIHARRGRQY